MVSGEWSCTYSSRWSCHFEGLESLLVFARGDDEILAGLVQRTLVWCDEVETIILWDIG